MRINGQHNAKQIFCDVVIMPVQKLDGIGNIQPPSAPKLHGLKALIDTGATDTHIAPKAAHNLDLEPIGLRSINTAGGEISQPYYLFHVGFIMNAIDKTQMLIPDQPLEGIELAHDHFGFDILLGMDIISQGRLVITQTKFEFSLPSS